MKFDFVIGNPPYQDETIGDNKGFAPPVYNKFLNEAYKISEVVEMIHPARFLFNAGSTPKRLNYEADASKIFSNTDIKGGVVISYHNMAREYNAIRFFTPYKALNSIMSKAAPKNETLSLMSIIFLQNKFNLDVLYADYPEYKKIIGSDGKDKRFRNNIFEKISLFKPEKTFDDDVKIIGVSKNKRVWLYRYFCSV